jgi:thymidine phosphorylase
MPDRQLHLVRLGIDTHQEPVVYMRADCHVCRSEGFAAHSRVRIETDAHALVATLNVVHGDLLEHGEAGLSEAAWHRLEPQPRSAARFSHPPAVESLSAVRAKIYGHTLSEAQIAEILRDVAAGRYTDVEIAALLTACTTAGLGLDEVVGLTRGMVAVGDRLHWDREIIADKHCVGGLPGNRTTPIVVAIVAALGVWIPKTSSRAITSPAGTADTMETLTRVDLDLAEMRGGEPDAPRDLRARGVTLAGEVLELAGHCPIGSGASKASAVLADGRAWRKLQAICEAQSGMREPGRASHRWKIEAPRSGTVAAIDNRRLAREAKLAGAPGAKAAGIHIGVRLGERVERGEPLFELHAETAGELDYARTYLDGHTNVVQVEAGA